jgi:hypothetical protein
MSCGRECGALRPSTPAMASGYAMWIQETFAGERAAAVSCRSPRKKRCPPAPSRSRGIERAPRGPTRRPDAAAPTTSRHCPPGRDGGEQEMPQGGRRRRRKLVERGEQGRSASRRGRESPPPWFGAQRRSSAGVGSRRFGARRRSSAGVGCSAGSRAPAPPSPKDLRLSSRTSPSSAVGGELALPPPPLPPRCLAPLLGSAAVVPATLPAHPATCRAGRCPFAPSRPTGAPTRAGRGARTRGGAPG